MLDNFRPSMKKKKNISQNTKKLNPGSSSKNKNKIFKHSSRNSEKKFLVFKTIKWTLGTTWKRNKLRKHGDFLEKQLNQAALPLPTCGTKSLLLQVAEAALGPRNRLLMAPLQVGRSKILGPRQMGSRKIKPKL